MAIQSSPAYRGTLIRRGSTGPDVALVQTLLNGLNQAGRPIRRLGVDGKFGAGTESAVRQFQALEGLKADGIVGRDTWDRLNAAYTAALGRDTYTLYPGISLRRGDRGSTVRSLQQELAAAGFSLNPDGIFGSATQTAVRGYQAGRRLTADGIATSAVQEALYADNAPRNSAAAESTAAPSDPAAQ